MAHRKSMQSESDSDEDDDLRSLLSGNSLTGGSGSEVQNPHRLHQQQQSQQDSPISIGSSASQSQLYTLDDNGSNTMNNNRSNHHHGGSSSSKKSLWILGTIILILGFLGPSGLLWDMLESDDMNDDESTNKINIDYGGDINNQRYMSIQQQQPHHSLGDKHHHIPQAPHQPPAMNDNYKNANNENVHPMIRSANAMERASSNVRNQNVAPGSRKHEQFGTKRTKKERARDRQRGGGRNQQQQQGWGIKDAIENLDKVFMDNRPVAASTVVKKKKNMNRGENDDTFLQSTDDQFTEVSGGGTGGGEVIPVIHADDDTLPKNADELDTYTYSLPASDALECRASVKAFVINATDVRDECDGLRKAFDKTCSVVHNEPSGGGAPSAVVSNDNVAAAASGGSSGMGRRRRRRRRRRLSEWGQPHLWNLIPQAFHNELKRAGNKMKSQLFLRRRLSDDHGHANHGMLHRSNNRTLHETSGQVGGHSSGVEQRKMEEVDVDSPEENRPVQQQKQQQPKQEQVASPPKISLNIPTSDKHITEEMLSDALLLQSSDTKPIKASTASMDTSSQAQQQQVVVGQLQDGELHDDIAAQPVASAAAVVVNKDQNRTAESEEANKDAAESAEAIRTAVEGVKNIMNDPKSIEARTCCASILSVFHEHCDPTTTGVEDYSDRRLLVVVFVITVCGMVKSLIRHLNIRWLPEAGGCILVGVFGYLILEVMPHVQFAFDGDMFLRIMVPPIVFEAAVKINKQSFRRHVIPITIFAIVGTLVSTAFTAFLLHKASAATSFVTTIPVRESLIFGALISSIDPIAVLSVLNNMGITDSDTIYVLIFGESLLNDGVAIVLFQTLVHFLDESLVIDADVVFDAFMHFVVVALGSIMVGALSGACATVYFAIMHGCQTPMVEVIMFCCFSFVPYYICDMVEWSGIVAIVANGFVMDLYVIGQKDQHRNSDVDDEIDFLVNGSSSNNGNNGSRARNNRRQQCRSIFSYEGHLSQKADSHVHFVIEIFATLMETAIFAYLGLFLFSPRYHWSVYLTVISISATVMGRVIMIPILSHVANIFNRMSTSRNRTTNGMPNNEGVHIDRRMQLVLIFAGLRGAMSFALVEHIPMFDTTTGQGSRLKPELKAMTSASVMFTVFVLGGATSYVMERLGYSINKSQHPQDAIEIAPLVPQEKKSPTMKQRSGSSIRSNGSVRQRGPR